MASIRDDIKITKIPVKIPQRVKELKQHRPMPVMVGTIYDPTKLWVVIFHEEFQAWSRYLNNFYYRNRLNVPEFMLRSSMMCIGLIDGYHYRAITLPKYTKLPNFVKLFLIDTGVFYVLPMSDIFFINHAHCKQDRYALRATIRNVAPPNNSQFWSKNEVDFLFQNVFLKPCTLLIDGYDASESALIIQLFVHEDNMASSAAELMRKAGKAIPFEQFQRCPVKDEKYECLVPYPFLLPSFQSIEQGLVASTLEGFLADRLVKLHTVLPSEFGSIIEYSPIRRPGRTSTPL